MFIRLALNEPKSKLIMKKANFIIQSSLYNFLSHRFIGLLISLAFVSSFISCKVSYQAHNDAKYSQTVKMIDNECYEGLIWTYCRFKTCDLFGCKFFLQRKIKGNMNILSNYHVYQKNFRVRSFKKSFNDLNLKYLKGGTAVIDSISDKRIYLTYQYSGVKQDDSTIEFPISVSYEFKPYYSEADRISSEKCTK
jgi:hypothetical protein